MHELALTQSLVDLVADRTAGRRVVAVHLRVGELSGWSPRRWSSPSTSSPRAGRSRAPRWWSSGPPATSWTSRTSSCCGRPHVLTCGCGADDARVSLPGAHEHPHPHPHPHGHEHETLVLEERLLAKNDHLAEHVRAFLDVRRITAVNLMSSPGSGKTSLLERTVAELGDGRPVYVVEGDQETSFDADRIERAGARAVQVNTGSGCHLDADMVGRSLHALDPVPGSLLFVENVGNLVCPALFDVGSTRGSWSSRSRGRRQAAEVPHHVRGRRPRRGQQDRPPAPRRLRPGPPAGPGPEPQPGRGRTAAVGPHGGARPGLVRLARLAHRPPRGARGRRAP
nr:hydrogenase nickel incorporation protein HypB [Nocardioides ungokensis]